MEYLPSPRYFKALEPKPCSRSIYPVFLPFSGCPSRCVFCAQPLQTGRAALALTPPKDPAHAGALQCLAVPVEEHKNEHGAAVKSILLEAESALLARRDKGQSPPELAFYGGTFTAQPEAVLDSCLAMARRLLDEGLVSAIRCSTRPDALGPGIIAKLAAAGLSCIELGVQSFCDLALQRSRRGYDGKTVLQACASVKESGLSLGVQLMPGMPGLCAEDALADVALAASLQPDFVRLYPCLVLSGTVLADWWAEGDFVPWELEDTVEFLAEACLIFWRKGIPVARMGLAEEAGLADGVLAGPRHPAMGAKAKSRALLRHIGDEIAVSGFSGPLVLEAPRRYQGEFFGIRNELAEAYAALGLHRSQVFLGKSSALPCTPIRADSWLL